MCHYALRSWPHSFRNSIHLYAHSHQKLPQFYRSFDVGVDGHNFTPWYLQEVISRVDIVKEEFKES
jgi:calcineurin-like phosphoesterase family protein